MCILKANPHPSPLPEGEGADRNVLRHASTGKTESIMDSIERFQVGVTHQHPRISPLSLWERARVRGS
ncbi:hypothetical protein C1893_30785 [Pseudomonas sp. MPR-ANC1]|nr:hypothetical protein C1893_30785 [Pseudomonas sp. MPR-ANC1]